MNKVRAMETGDLRAVLSIIGKHDDDDGEDASASFERDGIKDHYVLEQEGKPVGVCGFREVPSTTETYVLSWTYLASKLRGQGLGQKLFEHVLFALQQRKARKLFVKVSDYADKTGVKIYARALSFYKASGFTEELRIPDYYDEDEDQIILGLEIKPSAMFDAPVAKIGWGDTSNEDAKFKTEGGADEDAKFKTEGGADEDGADNETPAALGGSGPMIAEERPQILFNGLHEIAETEGAYSFAWTVKEPSGPIQTFVNKFTKPNFTVTDLQRGIGAVRDEGGRKVFLSFPSNLPLIHQPLKRTGFELLGTLKDYYEPGLHEMHFVYHVS